MSGHPADPATEAFIAHRNLLFTVAYEMLGSAADAEDVLQETWLRWVKADPEQVRDQRAYLVRITTRQSLNRLRAMTRRREAYVGPWLPEPLLTAPDAAQDVELAESMSMAMMLILETLSPTERAVFVLREVFDFGYDEIAETDSSTTGRQRCSTGGVAKPNSQSVIVGRSISRNSARNVSVTSDSTPPKTPPAIPRIVVAASGRPAARFLSPCLIWSSALAVPIHCWKPSVCVSLSQ